MRASSRNSQQALPAWSQSTRALRLRRAPCRIPGRPYPRGNRPSTREPCLDPLRTQLGDRLLEPTRCSLRERIASEEVPIHQLNRRQRRGDLALEIEWLVAAHRETEGPG